MATLVFPDGSFELRQDEVRLYTTIANVYEDCAGENIIRISHDICAHIDGFAHLRDDYCAIIAAGAIDLSRNVSQLELYLDNL